MGVFLSTTLDSGLVTEIINVAKSLLGLFTEFPINIFLYGGIAGVAFGVIRKARSTT